MPIKRDTKTGLTREEYKTQMTALGLRLGELQRECRNRGIPVIVVINGPSASGKGRLIGRQVRNLDPVSIRFLQPPRNHPCTPTSAAIGSGCRRKGA